MINDPLAAFVDDVIMPDPEKYKAFHNRETIYDEYTRWCSKSNSVPMSSRWFWPRLRQKVTLTEVREAYFRKVSIVLNE